VKPLPGEDLEHIERHTRALWERARRKRIFFTGATGFFGAWLLESFVYCNRVLNLGSTALVLCRNPNAVQASWPHLQREPSIQWLKGDIRNFEFPEGNFEFLVHAATPSTAAVNLDALDLLSTIVDGTKRTIAFAREGHVESFLFISSGAVYGPQPNSMTHIPEEYRGGLDWTHPHAAYAEGKRVAEMMCSVLAQETAIYVRIARCFAFVGPHLPLDRHFAIGNFIADALAARNILIRGDGTPMRSYLYAGDLAVWLWTLLLEETDREKAPAIYNIGSGQALSIRELAEHVTAELNPTLKIEVLRAALKETPLLQYVPDVSKAAERLSLLQRISIRQAIRRTAEWYR
jgi:dTDP-glucose 4,6-dehydratase